ncbi:hypothetical protein FIU83_15950 [Halomonas sp. THAF5a]|uniref:pilus assembly PilX family protein n=1 Tax=Halomonas sp. THAF5a TaxID=2587844 RepID=UPI0012681493|nr:PilX N-terminal domain-containing pilus assembly protein [Halomonas sp. THAF5a]QFU03134.1 hypothetical protein FIU83_15950 [Halomonas sp. THAF5a]
MPIVKRRAQTGAALLVTLILLALTGLLAFTGSQSSRLQQRLASNDQAAQIAFQAAEAALREAFQELDEAPHRINFCEGGSERYEIDSINALQDDDVEAALASGVTVDGFSLGDGDEEITLAALPRYAIACVDESSIEGYTRTQSVVVGKDEVRGERYHFFRVIARGFGPNGNISRTLEARYVLQ